MGFKKKDVINELVNLYVARWNDYKGFMDDGKYEEAAKAYDDAKNALVAISEVKSKGIKALDVARAGADVAIAGASLATYAHFAKKSFEFEENGTISSTGGKNLMSESFRKLAPPKKI